jgi:hypothetical protein
MKPRSQRPADERRARSHAVRHVARNSLLRGSLVPMARTCGKAGCHCQQGEKHISLYLAVRRDNRRVMIYVPPTMENTVRDWVENAKEVDSLLEFISQQCLTEFLQQKQKAIERPASAHARTRKPRRKPP